MKFKIIILITFCFFSCSPQLTTLNLSDPYTAKGFAYIYNDKDYSDKIIQGKMNNEIMQISHQNLKTGTLIKLSNPKNKKNIVLKNVKRIRYPDFYKILITQPVAKELNLKKDLPIIEITEIKKNKSFVAKKAKIYNEEKKISSKAPVASVKISNISKEKIKMSEKKLDNIYIHLGTFYSQKNAKFLIARIINETNKFKNDNFKIKKVSNKETKLILGPYTAINLLKNDYIILKNFGFEELDIFINE